MGIGPGRSGGSLGEVASRRAPVDIRGRTLLARDCRVYIYNLATRLKVPVKGGAGLAEGIEVFPRQDELGDAQFGNALRGPLGVHRAVGQRFWF